MLLKWIVLLIGLIYDVAAWTLFGVYLLFTIILDIILLIKTVLFWIIHAFLWFLKQFVPPLVFIYKMIIYYLFRWNWWIYKISFNNIRKSINRNFYFISLWGAVLMVFVLLLFYGVGVLMGIQEIVIIGGVFSVLPLVWSYGEISSLRLRNAEDESFPLVRNNFQSGFDAIKAVLSYFIIFLLLVLTIVSFNITGWIPMIGFSFMGLALNINTLAILILLFVFVILIFAKLIMPPHVVYNKDFTPDINGSLNFLGVIGKRFLRYLFSSVSTIIFSVVVIFIPAFVVFLTILITLNVKNSLLDTRIAILNQRVSILEGLEKYKTSKNIERLYYFKQFPLNVITDFEGMKSLGNNIKNLKENIINGEKEIILLNKEFSDNINLLDKKIGLIKAGAHTDYSAIRELSQLEALKHTREDNFSKWKEDEEFRLSKMKVDVTDKNGMMLQLPLVFLFSVIWVSFFAGLVIAFLISYLGNVYFELYNFKEDDKPVYFRQIISELNTADRNQPLLGFTLIIILGLVLVNYQAILRLMNVLVAF